MRNQLAIGDAEEVGGRSSRLSHNTAGGDAADVVAVSAHTN
jgi:hypothetical protein